MDDIEDAEFYLNGSSSDPFEIFDYFHQPQYRFLERTLSRKLNRNRPPGMHGSYGEGPSSHEYQQDFDERKQEAEAYMEVKDESGSKRFELMPRDASLDSPLTPFSILVAQEEDSDEMFGLRAARNYSDEVLKAGRLLSDHLLADDISDLETDYDSGFRENIAYWIQEPMLYSALDRPEGVNDQIRNAPEELDPFTRSDYTILGQRRSHDFKYAKDELVLAFDWLNDPYSVGPNSRRKEAFGRRMATDEALGLDLTLDRSPNEYFLDSDEALGRDIISMGDPEFVLLTFDPDRLERERRDAMESIERGFKAQSNLSGGEIDFEEDKKEIFMHIGEVSPDNSDYFRFYLKDLAETGFDMDAFARDDVFSGGWF